MNCMNSIIQLLIESIYMSNTIWIKQSLCFRIICSLIKWLILVVCWPNDGIVTCKCCQHCITTPDSKVHGANMGPILGWQDPGGSHIGPMNFAIWDPIVRGIHQSVVDSPHNESVMQSFDGLSAVNLVRNVNNQSNGKWNERHFNAMFISSHHNEYCILKSGLVILRSVIYFVITAVVDIFSWKSDLLLSLLSHVHSDAFSLDITLQFPSMAALEVVILTTSSAARQEDSIKMTLSFQLNGTIFIETLLQHQKRFIITIIYYIV